MQFNEVTVDGQGNVTGTLSTLGTSPLSATAPYTATFSTSTLSAKSYNVQAVYITDGLFAGSSSAVGLETVTQIAPSIVWQPNVATIGYGTALGIDQLNATVLTDTHNNRDIRGTFIYDSPLGTVLPAGDKNVMVTFKPDDMTTYSIQTATVTIHVTPATLTVTADSQARNYGVDNPSFTFQYGPFVNGETAAIVTTPPTCSTTATSASAVGNYDITCSGGVAPNYSFNYVNNTLTINQATPTITWKPPASIDYGTPLDGTQLNATASTPGGFTYTPAAGAVLDIGTQTLSATFAPTDTTNYTGASASVTMAVNQAFGAQSLYLSTSSLAFGNEGLQVTSAARTVTLTNRSGAAVSPVIPASAGAFATSAGSCASVVPNSKSCTFTVIFTPTAAGAVAPATLNVQAGAATLPLALTGTGVQPLYLSTSTLDLGTVGMGVSTAAKTVYVYNYSGAAITPTIPASVGDYIITPGSTCGSVPNTKFCTFTVAFKPSGTSPSPNSLTIQANQTTQLSLPLSGTGVQPLYLNTSALAFGNEGVGVTATNTVYLYNYSGSQVNAQIPASTPTFTVGGGAGCASLANNASCNFTVTFNAPSTPGVVPSTPLNVMVGATTLPLTATGRGV